MVVFHWAIESVKNDAIISAQVFIYQNYKIINTSVILVYDISVILIYEYLRTNNRVVFYALNCPVKYNHYYR